MAASTLLHALVLQRRGYEFARKEHAAADFMVDEHRRLGNC